MKRPPSLKTAMTPFPYAVDIDAPLDQARQLMARHQVHHLPVTEGHDLVGVLTDRDITAALAGRSAADAASILKVRDLYIAEAYIVDLSEPLDNVLLTMAERHIGSALVTKHGNLAGVFTTVDACRSFGDYLRANFPRPDGNEAA